MIRKEQKALLDVLRPLPSNDDPYRALHALATELLRECELHDEVNLKALDPALNDLYKWLVRGKRLLKRTDLALNPFKEQS